MQILGPVAQQGKLNGFQNRCLRKIVGIPPAYRSRVSNATVLTRTSYKAATELLRKKRLQLFGKVLRAPPNHPLKRACFIPNTFVPVTDHFVRRVGRPCREWVRETLQETTALFGSLEVAIAQAEDKSRWNSALTHKLGI